MLFPNHTHLIFLGSIIIGMNTTFCELARKLETENLLTNFELFNTSDLDISGCACDSRCVKKDNIFICKGANFKPQYLIDAVELGANCYLCDESIYSTLSAQLPNLPYIIVSNIRTSMAIVSRMSFGYPDLSINIAGVTGTKGKSTVSYMLREIIDGDKPGSKASVIGTIETYDGVESFQSHNTTPESPDLFRHLYNAEKTGHTPVLMEVSSQGLKYERVLGLHLTVGCFLNIGRDHISALEHPNFEDYFTSKLKIFELCDTAVVNLDSDMSERVLHAAKISPKLITVSSKNKDADIYADNIKAEHGKTIFDVHTDDWLDTFELNMPGLFNVDNALAAIAIAIALGCDSNQIKDGLARTHVPGRMELLKTSNPNIAGIVDFAHNKLAFEKFFPSTRKEFPGYKIISVFGAPGGKAFERRKELVEVAEQYSDHIIFCEDDPGVEEAMDICTELESNITGNTSHEIVLDRTDATIKAIKIAREWDQPCVICLLAKGDDKWMHRGNDYVPTTQDVVRFEKAAKQLID